MKLVSQKSHAGASRAIFVILSVCLAAMIIFGSSCNVPNLESPECTQARDTLRQFYSWHIGTSADDRIKQPEIQNKFVSPGFLPDPNNSADDPFTFSKDMPKTFKIGKCESSDEKKVTMQVQLYWRDDSQTVQKEVRVEEVKTSDAWLINKVTN